MDFPTSHPLWMWLYFGAFGTADLILFALVMWSWTRFNALADGRQRSAARWNVIGYLCLFASGWFACGIGGPLGNMLSANPTVTYLDAAITASTLSMFFTIPGWVCLLVGQRKMIEALAAGQGSPETPAG